MRYLRVIWRHAFPAEPVLLYSEVDEEGWERRKLEIFADGRVGFADSAEQNLSTFLSETQIPSNDEIASDAQFVPSEIGKEEFERVWAQRRSGIIDAASQG
ncbi:MAG: hypothetical protein KDJ41_15435 [Hyphomicrobiaceae bacterium]|nr:hypothetical protein [Hyphomicrobiaceae bacterium]